VFLCNTAAIASVDQVSEHALVMPMVQ